MSHSDTTAEKLKREEIGHMPDLMNKTLSFTGASRGYLPGNCSARSAKGANIVIAAKTTEPNPKLHQQLVFPMPKRGFQQHAGNVERKYRRRSATKQNVIPGSDCISRDRHIWPLQKVTTPQCVTPAFLRPELLNIRNSLNIRCLPKRKSLRISEA
jgi:hypothetical protein